MINDIPKFYCFNMVDTTVFVQSHKSTIGTIGKLISIRLNDFGQNLLSPCEDGTTGGFSSHAFSEHISGTCFGCDISTCEWYDGRDISSG